MRLAYMLYSHTVFTANRYAAMRSQNRSAREKEPLSTLANSLEAIRWHVSGDT